MAIRIPILTSFDPKGLKSANAAFANLGTQVASLGRNFAVLGAAAVGVGAFLGKAVGAASDVQESVNAVNVAFGQSAAGILEFGETAATSLGTSQVEFNNAAVRFSAFADRIVGSGNDASKFIADISVRASDFASVFNIEVSEALGVFQSGLAGEAEPLKRFGINLLDSEVKAYAAANGIGEVGRQLTETEKVQARYGLLMQETSKTSGDFANTSDGLANSMRIMKANIADTQAEIGQQLLPILEEIIPVVRDMVSEFGDKLLVAVQAVDWKTLLTQIADLTQFFLTHIETIVKVVAAFWALSTIVKTVNVLFGIGKVAADLYAWAMAQIATKTALATVATHLLRAAMILLPFAVLTTAFIIGANGAKNLTTEMDANRRAAESLNPELQNLAYEAEYTGGKFGYVAGAFSNAGKEARDLRDDILDLDGTLQSDARNRELDRYLGFLGGRAQEARVSSIKGPDLSSIFDASNAAEAAAEAQRAADEIASANEMAAQEAADAVAAIQAEALRKEQEILDKRENAYKSFKDSVEELFGQIKNSILSAFNLPDLGKSVNSITKNIQSLLRKTKDFAGNITNLSGMGLNSDLLQQVIQAGPLAGGQLASALVGGGSAFIGQLNEAYGEFGGLAGSIAGVGTRSAFATEPVVNNFNIEINTVAGDPVAIERVVLDAISRANRRGTTGLTV
jgi:hypothetical protein